MEIKTINTGRHEDYNIFKTSEELLNSFSEEIPEAKERKTTIQKELDENPEFSVFRWTQQCPYQGIRDHDDKVAKFGRLPALYTCLSSDDGYRGTDGAWSQTWSGYYLLKDTGTYDADHRRVYKDTSGRHLVFLYHCGSPSSWSSASCQAPRF